MGGILLGTAVGVRTGDTRRLDYSSFGTGQMPHLGPQNVVLIVGGPRSSANLGPPPPTLKI